MCIQAFLKYNCIKAMGFEIDKENTTKNDIYKENI